MFSDFLVTRSVEALAKLAHTVLVAHTFQVDMSSVQVTSDVAIEVVVDVVEPDEESTATLKRATSSKPLARVSSAKSLTRVSSIKPLKQANSNISSGQEVGSDVQEERLQVDTPIREGLAIRSPAPVVVEARVDKKQKSMKVIGLRTGSPSKSHKHVVKEKPTPTKKSGNQKTLFQNVFGLRTNESSKRRNDFRHSKGRDKSVNDNQVNDNQVNDNQVNDNQVNDNQVNDNQVNDNQVNDNQVNDNQVNDNQVDDNQDKNKQETPEEVNPMK